MRQFALEMKPKDVIFIHVTLVPFLAAAGELKTKPTQQSVAKLREIGIQPHVLVCRCDHPLGTELRDKLSMFCNVPVKAVIECRDVDSSIYQLPLALQKEGMDELVLDLLGFSIPAPKKNIWIEIVRRLLNPRHEVTIGVVGKYIELQDAYKSVYESIAHAGIANTCRVNVRRIDAEDLEKKGGTRLLRGLDGILVPGGFGDRGTEGKIAAARYARERGVPYFGLCLGLQIAVIEVARNVLKLPGANSTEFDPKCADPVINMMEEQKAITDKGATMRLGSYDCALTARQPRRQGVRGDPYPGAPPAPLRGEQRLPGPAEEGDRRQRDQPDAQPCRDHRAQGTTPGSWRSSSTPSSSRSRTGPIRCSRRSSRRRSGTGAGPGPPGAGRGRRA